VVRPHLQALQLFLHVEPSVLRREARQLAKHLVAVLLVKAGGLEAEGVEKGIPSALLARFIFQRLQQLAAEATAAQRFGQPHQIDIQPIPEHNTDHASGSFSGRPAHHKTNPPRVVIACMLGVVGGYALPNSAPGFFHRIRLLDDLVFIAIHDLLLN
jgi:hypothetical protein